MTLADERALSRDYVALVRDAKILATRCQEIYGLDSRCAERALKLANECESLARMTNPDRTPPPLPVGTTLTQVL